MKILHICLANFYIDNYGYQENILPKMHKLQGHEVAILASTETYIGAELGYVEPSSYVTKDGLPIKRIPYIKWLPHSIAKKLRRYLGVSKALYAFQPDILFIHGPQFISMQEIVSFVKKHPDVRVYVDNHADYINSGINWLSMNILHKVIYKWTTKIIEPYTKKFYGVLPIRVDFLKDVYGTPEDKTELLVLGIDDSNIDFKNRIDIRTEIRKGIGIKDEDFVIITGGKIDKRKNIHLLMKAVGELEEDRIKLIVFGNPSEDIKEEFDDLIQHEYIYNAGWVTPKEANDYFFAADLACFPGTHSVLWEQAVGLGLPAIFKRWNGMEHINLNGNCVLLDDVCIETLKNNILDIYANKKLYQSMCKVASRGIEVFSYYNIAKRAIED